MFKQYLTIIRQILRRRKIRIEKKKEKRNNKNSFNNKQKMRNHRKNIDEKKRKHTNYFHFICHKCNKVEYIVTKYFDLKKKFTINAIFNKFKKSKISKKEKSSTTINLLSKTKN